MGRAKRGARKGRVPALPPEPPSQIAGRLSSSCPPSQLLSSCSGFTAAEKDSSDGSDWEISVCSQNRVAFSRDCPWIHITSALPSLSLRLLPNNFVSPHPTFFPLFPNLLCPSWTAAVTPVSIDRPSSLLLIDSEWHAGETRGAAPCEETCTISKNQMDSPNFWSAKLWSGKYLDGFEFSWNEWAYEFMNQPLSLLFNLTGGSTTTT